MTHSDPFVYWKAGPGAPKATIGGWCRESDLASYAIVEDLELPNEIIHTTSGEGVDRVDQYVTPPIFGSRYVYRYRLSISRHTRRALAGRPDMWMAFRELRAERIEGPMTGARRTNWWWAEGEEKYWRGCEAPVRLIVKWAEPLLKILVAACDMQTGDDILAAHRERIERHKSSCRRDTTRRENRMAYGEKRDGTIVVSERIVPFNSGVQAQIFVLRPFGQRKQLGPHDTGHCRYKIPAKTMQPVHPDWLEKIAAAGPIGYIALLAAKTDLMAKATSSHDRIRAAGLHDSAIRDWAAKSETWLRETRAACSGATDMSEDLHKRLSVLLACRHAIANFKDTPASAPWTEIHTAVRDLLGILERLEAPIPS